MALNVDSKAAAVGSAVKNVTFLTAANNVPRKILIIGTQAAAKSLTPNVPIQTLGPEDTGDKAGFGSMLHRLSVRSSQGGQGIETWFIPQDEAGGAVVATGDIDFTGSTGVLAGTVYLYIAGLPVPFTVAAGATPSEIATAGVAAINALSSAFGLPVTAVVTLDAIDFTAISKGPWGNDISIALNLGPDQSLPTGVTAAITGMASGAGVPAIADALDGLGTGDDANEAFFTDVVHGYGLDTTSLDAISAYVGAGNDFIGLYAKTVGRPFRSLTGDVTADAAGLTALQVITDARKTDRANGIIAAPGSQSHPSEIAALAIGNMARTNQDRAAQHYIGILLSGIWPGDTADRWTSSYDNRDIAVKSGISPTKVSSGNVFMQNMVTFYRPDSVPVDSNGYRSMRNISILQNIIANVRVTFSAEKWQGISIVEDTSNVSNVTDREKARDIDSVKDDLVALAKDFESRAWIFEAAFTIDKLKEPSSVAVRDGASGFDNTLSVILSGEGSILDTVTQFDTSIAILT